MKFAFTWDAPTRLPCEPPMKDFEEEFGLHHVEEEAKPDHQQCIKVSVSAFLVLIAVAAAVVLYRERLVLLLDWLAALDPFSGAIVFTALFCVVSFPMMWGYLVLNLAAGYMWGLVHGSIITCIGANVGGIVSFLICRRMFKGYVLKTLGQYDNFRQILRVLEGRRGFRIILMTRLTPVPFGLQNALFSASKVSLKNYIVATFLGLLPTLVLNTYMGTSLRSMEDVLAGKSGGSALLWAQVVVAVAVTLLINRRMKAEVHNACQREQANMTGLPTSNVDIVKEPSQTDPLIHLPRQPSLHLLTTESLAAAAATAATAATAAAVAAEAAAASTNPVLDVLSDDDSDDSGVSGVEPLLRSPSRQHSSANLAALARGLSVKNTPTTAGGEFVRGHRRSQSAGAAVHTDIIKLSKANNNNKLGLVVKAPSHGAAASSAPSPSLGEVIVL